ncbi:serine/threonine protein kinase [Mycobacterium sp. 852002-51163_SCH5372311]|uniref:serine/threonine-protein kinase n=1 Tax=Mycobacterium sp. 852002-51163_SCH5372311 TaxID=1834097 RepID=UPI0008008DFB|nr:serine/threonine-protein kinase [Mycobacterium sp. 852002-51163_SCH5372311]OBF79676.1 serine/threonine protein kinase [Mycobacterium sp. 852002-51163_SCH5372311]
MPQPDGLSEGEIFAGYTIIRRLGAGGMGQVYLAQHPRLPRRDALKILPTEVSADLEFRQRFNREAELAASLYHEHIVGIHDRGEYEGQLWISMDYVEGTDAARLLSSQYPSGMPRTDVVEIASAVAEALDHAHSRGLLHRDVKPANILLGDAHPRRRILLADFGIARELGEISGLTATNMAMGTTAYSAPEQLQGADLDGRADQYALGCTAFHLLTGNAPFQHSNPAVVITHHLSAPPPRVSEHRPELAELDAVIAQAMAKNPDERYATCSDFASALAGTPVTAAGSTDSGPTRAVATPESSSLPKRTRRLGPAALIAAAVTIVLVAVAVVVGARMLGSHSHRQAGGVAAPAAPSSANAAPPSTPTTKLAARITDEFGVLTPAEHFAVNLAITRLDNRRGTHLWVVYVKNFGGVKPLRWAEDTMRANGFGDADAMLAVATDESAFSFRVPEAVTNGKPIEVDRIRRERIKPAVDHQAWARAALAAAEGLEALPG